MSRNRARFAQNFLRKPSLAALLVQQSSLVGSDLILEIGPGEGIFTTPLSRIARRVIAVEIDPSLVRRLQARFPPGVTNVDIVGADFTRFRLPQQPCKVFSNVPFNRTAEILRHLLDAPQISEAWLILQRQAAEKHAGIPDETKLSVFSKPRWQFNLIHHFRRVDFIPSPAVPVVLMQMKRRSESLLSQDDESWYRRFVSHGFQSTKPNLRLSYKRIFTHAQWCHLSRNLDFDREATPTQLTFGQWLGLFRYFMSGVDRSKQLLLERFTSAQKWQQDTSRQ